MLPDADGTLGGTVTGGDPAGVVDAGADARGDEDARGVGVEVDVDEGAGVTTTEGDEAAGGR